MQLRARRPARHIQQAGTDRDVDEPDSADRPLKLRPLPRPTPFVTPETVEGHISAPVTMAGSFNFKLRVMNEYTTFCMPPILMSLNFTFSFYFYHR